MYTFVLLFCLLLHRLSVRISLPFQIFLHFKLRNMKLHVLMIIELGPPVVFLAKRPNGEDRGETAVFAG